MGTRYVVLLALVLTGAALGVAWRSVSSNGSGSLGGPDRASAAEISQVRGWARSQGGAGISVVPKRVPVADERELRQVTELPGFHEYAMRCSSCHELPDPAAYPAERWAGKVQEMKDHVDRSGMLPSPVEQIEAAVDFLEAASDSLR